MVFTFIHRFMGLQVEYELYSLKVRCSEVPTEMMADYMSLFAGSMQQTSSGPDEQSRPSYYWVTLLLKCTKRSFYKYENLFMNLFIRLWCCVYLMLFKEVFCANAFRNLGFFLLRFDLSFNIMNASFKKNHCKNYCAEKMQCNSEHKDAILQAKQFRKVNAQHFSSIRLSSIPSLPPLSPYHHVITTLISSMRIEAR